MAPTYHIPALLQETIDGLAVKADGTYVDCTFGGGGHSRAIMALLGPQGHLIGIDRDNDARANAIDDKRFTFVHGNFAYMTNYLRFLAARAENENIEESSFRKDGEPWQVDGIVADLGVSFHHFDDAQRGFSFRNDAPLDMRMNRKDALTAAKIVNEYEGEKLAWLLWNYGELRRAKQMAAAIVKARANSPIATTGDLVQVVTPLISPAREKKELAQVFQALRMEVNDEPWALRRLLEQAAQALRPGGRIAIITYHSLEDRLVKNFLRSGTTSGVAEKDFFGNTTSPWQMVNRHVIIPTEEEVERNPRSRSAKLRVATRN